MRKLHIDGTGAEWLPIAEALTELRSLNQRTAIYAYVTVPKSYKAEAKRLLRYLDLEERVLFEPPPSNEELLEHRILGRHNRQLPRGKQ